MERHEQSLEEYLATLDAKSRERVIQQESLWHLQHPSQTPPAPAEPAKPKQRRRQRPSIG
mgnify:CR=1 FL=1